MIPSSRKTRHYCDSKLKRSSTTIQTKHCPPHLAIGPHFYLLSTFIISYQGLWQRYKAPDLVPPPFKSLSSRLLLERGKSQSSHQPPRTSLCYTKSRNKREKKARSRLFIFICLRTEPLLILDLGAVCIRIHCVLNSAVSIHKPDEPRPFEFFFLPSIFWFASSSVIWHPSWSAFPPPSPS